MASSATAIDYKQEVRFAIVMYGGVSLAIYINGIAQELYHLVSSTAREKAGVDSAPSPKISAPLSASTASSRTSSPIENSGKRARRKQKKKPTLKNRFEFRMRQPTQQSKLVLSSTFCPALPPEESTRSSSPRRWRTVRTSIN